MPRPSASRVMPDDLTRLRLPSSASISPDGRWVVFVERSCDLTHDRLVQGLRLVEVDSGTVRSWTGGPYKDSAPSWLPDSRGIVFASDRDGGEALWRIGLRDREPERLTTMPGRVRDPRVSPDGRFVAFVGTRIPVPHSVNGDGPPRGPEVRPVTQLGFKHDGVGLHDGNWMHLWILDLRTGKVRALTSGSQNDTQPDWSPDGRYLAFVSNRMPRADVHFANSDIYVVPARGGRVRQLTREPGPKSSPSWSPDGRTIAFVGHMRYPDTVENLHVWVVPFAKGAPRDLMPDADLMCDDLLLADTKEFLEGMAPRPVWSADGRRIFFVASVRGAANIWEIDARGGEPRQRSFGEHEIPGLTQAAGGGRWAFVRITSTSPGDVFVAEAGAGGGRAPSIVPGARARRLTKLNDEFLARRRIVEPEEMHVPCIGGHVIHGWVLRAPGTGRGPAVLMLHGGPYAAYGSSFFHELQMLVGAGYHVFYLNPRGSASYGRDFMRSLVGRWGHTDAADLTRMTDAIESLPFVDPRRIALGGGSYGGYLTNWAITHTQRYKCAISMRGISNFVSLYGTSDMGWDLANEFEAQPPWTSMDRWWRVSPLAHVENIRTPLLLLHPEDDHRCPVSQSEEMFTALRVLGRDVEFVRFQGESHGLSRAGRPHNRIERLRLILDWLERKL